MIQAIETVYAGIKFRSRLEARWAVFMDTLGVTWEYETEGFLLPDGVGYLPDFFVPTIGWIEVKPSYEQDNGKWERFCESHVQEEEFRAFRLAGDIPDPSTDIFNVPLNIDAFWGGMMGGFDRDYMWCWCQSCGKVGLQYEGRYGRICKHEGYSDHECNPNSARLKVAYIAARSARFND